MLVFPVLNLAAVDNVIVILARACRIVNICLQVLVILTVFVFLVTAAGMISKGQHDQRPSPCLSPFMMSRVSQADG